MPLSDQEVPISDFDRRLAEAFQEGLDLPPDTDVTTLAFEQHAHWDSLGHVQLVIALEEKFGLELTGDEVLQITSYAAAAEVVRSRQPHLS